MNDIKIEWTSPPFVKFISMDRNELLFEMAKIHSENARLKNYIATYERVLTQIQKAMEQLLPRER